MTVQRHRQGDRRRADQDGDHRRIGPIVRIVDAAQVQRADHQQHANHHRLQHQPAAAPVERQRQLKRNQREPYGKQRMIQRHGPNAAPIETAHA